MALPVFIPNCSSSVLEFLVCAHCCTYPAALRTGWCWWEQVERGRTFKACCIAFPWKCRTARGTISTSFVLNSIDILIVSHPREEKQQKQGCVNWLSPPWFWGCLNAVWCKLERSAESLFKPWCSACKSFGQGSKQKSLKTGYYYPKDGIYLMNLHSLPLSCVI